MDISTDASPLASPVLSASGSADALDLADHDMRLSSDSLTRSKRRRLDSAGSSVVSAPTGSHPATAPLTETDATLSRRWQQTIERVVPSIVSVRFMVVAAFDTEHACTSEATGFVVDAEQGLILTNRHVVGPGPFVGHVVFHNHEELDVIPIYRDPIHDFGFLKYDPSKLKYLTVDSIPLRPDLAKVGLEIRVCGNDAGEKLSIMAGSISRLDRNAPEYGDLTYNDSDTFYIQAAASTSGGSSGSPVVDIDGNAVALQAGGRTEAATDFFLPLPRVLRALHLLQRGEPIVRGTIQTVWLHRPFDEARRLGLRPETEAAIRSAFQTEIGMLVAEIVLPESPAYGHLQEGDVLIKVNGEFVTQFVPLEVVLDDSVGGTMTLSIERGGTPLDITLQVGDLHAITPDKYLDVGGGKLNNLSYQLARHYGVAVKGVYVAQAAGMFHLDGSSHGLIVDSINSQPVSSIEDMIPILQAIPDRERIPITYYFIDDVHTKSVSIATMDKHWAPFRLAVRNDVTGKWDFTDLNTNAPPEPTVTVQRAVVPEFSLGPVTSLMPSVVRIAATSPVMLDGVPSSRASGTGLVVDADLGLVLVSRAVVQFDLVDIMVTFWDAVQVPARAVFIHPVHNYAIVQYATAQLDAPVLSAPLSSTRAVPGQKVDFLAVTHNQRPVHVATTVTDVNLLTIPCSGEPRPRAINFDAITLDSPLASTCASGVLADPTSGEVVGLWATFTGERNNSTGNNMEYYLGIPMADVVPIISRVRDRVRSLMPPPSTTLTKLPSLLYPLPDLGLTVLNVEWQQTSLVQARAMGVPDTWLARVQDAKKRHILRVRRVESGRECDGVLRELDLVLTMDGALVNNMADVTAAVTRANSAPMTLRVVRRKQLVDVVVTPAQLDAGTDRCILWCGALIQVPHKAVRQQCRDPPSGCYVSRRQQGSPAVMFELTETTFVTHVNEHATPDLDAFLAAVRNVPDGAYVRVKVCSFDFIPAVISVRTNAHYFPTSEIRRDPTSPHGWAVTKISDEAEAGTPDASAMAVDDPVE
ncbi:hypothetical protein AMAG_14362 [Allomyces macrogynus ATCC 38327]|uniref:PDZ domain-containing protein n=1 Tax=Allomyces macrogynus (strain ATCC 38327) TaxID=578462 RepID=A0A0L0T509_ALLM3|nr:hypothetical protein AMAG_14362 [Allomyces macrogynus ATCC 38327]|eukprot:KNE69830.1 hypothetical protein AMAG_14362 [Allomyces macrogynus ATCC 38327]